MSATVTIAAGQFAFGTTSISTPQTKVALADSTTRQSGDGLYTVSVNSAGQFIVTKGKPPQESSVQLNVVQAVVAQAGTQVFLTDVRNRQVTHETVNFAILHQIQSDGSPLADGIVTIRTLSDAVLALISSGDLTGSGTGFPTTPTDGELFFRVDQGILYIFEGGTWFAVTGATALAGLSDVALTTLVDGQVLTYVASAGKWKNTALPVQSVGVTAPIVNSGTATNPIIGVTIAKRAVRLHLCSSDYTPPSGGPDQIAIVPYDPASLGTPVTWNVVETYFRIETAASSGATSVNVEHSTAVGAFANVGNLFASDLSIAAGAYESRSTPGSPPTVASGDKLLTNWTALGTGAASFSLYLTLQEQ